MASNLEDFYRAAYRCFYWCLCLSELLQTDEATGYCQGDPADATQVGEEKSCKPLRAKEFAQMLVALSSSLLLCPQQGVWAVYSKWHSRTTSSGHQNVSARPSKEALLLWLHSMKAVTFTELSSNQLHVYVTVLLYQVSTAQDFGLKSLERVGSLTFLSFHFNTESSCILLCSVL